RTVAVSARAAVASCVRADARRMWVSWIALGLITGLAAGAVMAAAAAARRTASAYERLVERTNAPSGGITFTCDVATEGCPASPSDAADVVRNWPGVKDAAAVLTATVPIVDVNGDLVQAHDDPCDSSSGALQVVAPLDGRLGTDLLRVRLTDGRL